MNLGNKNLKPLNNLKPQAFSLVLGNTTGRKSKSGDGKTLQTQPEHDNLPGNSSPVLTHKSVRRPGSTVAVIDSVYIPWLTQPPQKKTNTHC